MQIPLVTKAVLCKNWYKVGMMPSTPFGQSPITQRRVGYIKIYHHVLQFLSGDTNQMFVFAIYYCIPITIFFFICSVRSFNWDTYKNLGIIGNFFSLWLIGNKEFMRTAKWKITWSMKISTFQHQTAIFIIFYYSLN